jgi:hypothetical protein
MSPMLTMREPGQSRRTFLSVADSWVAAAVAVRIDVPDVLGLQIVADPADIAAVANDDFVVVDPQMVSESGCQCELQAPAARPH